MNIRAWAILCIVSLGLLAAACGPDWKTTRVEQPGRGWTTVKSPISDKCFEVFSSVKNGYANGIAEIACTLHEQFQDDEKGK